MLYTIKNDKIKVVINSLGAELQSVVYNNTEYIWNGDSEVWPRRAPNLFPICGKLEGDYTIIKGQRRKIGQHGFARDYEHQLIQKFDNRIVFEFKPNDDTKKIYPYDFVYRTSYVLRGRTVLYGVEIINQSKDNMPYSAGGHTGFTTRLNQGNVPEDYELIFEKPETPTLWHTNNTPFLDGEKSVFFENQQIIKLSKNYFTNSFIMSDLKSEFVSLVNTKTNQFVKQNIKGFPYVLIWSKPENLPFVCIEPWDGLPDHNDTNHIFEEKLGIKILEPQESARYDFSFEIG